LADLLSDTYVALRANLSVLGVIGFRTCFDRATELVGIEPNLSFSAKLNQLLNRGLIGAAEKQLLELSTDAGSAAAHRGWKPSADDIQVVKQTVEAFIFRNFVLQENAEKLKMSVPQRARGQKKERA